MSRLTRLARVEAGLGPEPPEGSPTLWLPGPAGCSSRTINTDEDVIEAFREQIANAATPEDRAFAERGFAWVESCVEACRTRAEREREREEWKRAQTVATPDRGEH
jgi:hypothetical protein